VTAQGCDIAWLRQLTSRLPFTGMRGSRLPLPSFFVHPKMREELQRLKRETETGRALAATSASVPAVTESGKQVATAQTNPASSSTPAVAASPSRNENRSYLRRMIKEKCDIFGLADG